MTYRRCTECGRYNHFQFYNPGTIYCGNCGRKVGTTDKHVYDDMAALKDDTVVHVDSGETLATVEWDEEKVTR